jgi:hypothetical protein
VILISSSPLGLVGFAVLSSTSKDSRPHAAERAFFGPSEISPAAPDG